MDRKGGEKGKRRREGGREGGREREKGSRRGKGRGEGDLNRLPFLFVLVFCLRGRFPDSDDRQNILTFGPGRNKG